jgi:hypothetical protein
VAHIIIQGRYRGLECRGIKELSNRSGWCLVSVVCPDRTTCLAEVHHDWIIESSAECFGCLRDMLVAGKSAVLCNLACANCKDGGDHLAA